jgi:hypothetical protein
MTLSLTIYLYFDHFSFTVVLIVMKSEALSQENVKIG